MQSISTSPATEANRFISSERRAAFIEKSGRKNVERITDKSSECQLVTCPTKPPPNGGLDQQQVFFSITQYGQWGAVFEQDV